MAVMVPSTAFLPRTIHLGVMPTDRKAIEAQIEALIDMLDLIDGDPDLEPDYEDYDACDRGEPLQHVKDLPRYGIDQSKGPINCMEVFGATLEELCPQ